VKKTFLPTGKNVCRQIYAINDDGMTSICRKKSTEFLARHRSWLRRLTVRLGCLSLSPRFALFAVKLHNEKLSHSMKFLLNIRQASAFRIVLGAAGFDVQLRARSLRICVLPSRELAARWFRQPDDFVNLSGSDHRLILLATSFIAAQNVNRVWAGRKSAAADLTDRRRGRANS
jgi:hypothetical protein